MWSQDPTILPVNRESSSLETDFIVKFSLQSTATTEPFKDTRYPVTNALFIASVKKGPHFPPREDSHAINSLILNNKSK